MVKGILNTPANPEGFMLGEVIEFTIAVTNNLPETVPHINIVDPLIPDWSYDIYGLEPGATASTTVTYTVTMLDCFNGSVENYVSGRAVVSDGYRFLTSNTVSADCMGITFLDARPVEDPFGILFGLEVEKAVESLPLNGSYYTEGENVAYKITYLNSGEVVLNNVMIYDALAGSDEIAAAEKLEPGESRTCFLKSFAKHRVCLAIWQYHKSKFHQLFSRFQCFDRVGQQIARIWVDFKFQPVCAKCLTAHLGCKHGFLCVAHTTCVWKQLYVFVHNML